MDLFEGCRKAARFYMERMQKAGLQCEMLTAEADDAHPVIAGISPCCLTEKKSAKTYEVLLVGHMDTVFPRGTFAKPMFREENGRFYGPGVFDMKGSIVMALLDNTQHAGDVLSRSWLPRHSRPSGKTRKPRFGLCTGSEHPALFWRNQSQRSGVIAEASEGRKLRLAGV